jgi:hypothetical protein
MIFTPPPGAPTESAPIPNRLTDDQPAFDVKTNAYLNWTAAFRTWLAGFVAWLTTFLAELGQALQGIEGNKNAAQSAAAAAETSAQNAAVIAGAVRWAPGDYIQGAAVWSPLSLLTYRRVPVGVTASAADPSLDPVGWRLTGSPYSMPQQELTTPGPHQLVVGMHYLLRHPQCECLMPVNAAPQEQLRTTNESGSSGLVLRRNGGLFAGIDDDVVIDARRADKLWTQTATRGWI